jgi:ribosome modulation factor
MSVNYKIPNDVEITSEYHNGAIAYMQGLNDQSCPYKGGDKRVRWMSGYWGERVRQFLLRFVAKYPTALT